MVYIFTLKNIVCQSECMSNRAAVKRCCEGGPLLVTGCKLFPINLYIAQQGSYGTLSSKALAPHS